MPESRTGGVNNSDISRKKDACRKQEIPNFREYTVIALLLLAWKRRRYGRNEHVDAYILRHFRKVLDEIERLYSSCGADEEAAEAEERIRKANRLFARELHRVQDRIGWIYE